MEFRKCSRCHIRPAIIFVQKNEGGKITSEGFCIKCAQELGIKPIDDIINQMNMSQEDIDALSEGMSGLMPMAQDDDDDDKNGRAPSIDLGSFFGGKNAPVQEETGDTKTEKKQKRRGV